MNKLIVLLSFLVFLPSIGQAQYADESGGSYGSNHQGIYATAGLFYSFDDRQRSSSTSTSSTLYNLRLGFSFANGFRLGLKYAAENGKTTDDANNRDDKETVTDYGLFVGYQWHKFFATFGYLFGSDWKFESSGATSTFTDAVGIQFDIGMEFSVGNNIYIGPRLTYKNITYKTQETSGTSTTIDPALNREYLDPFFFVAYKF